MPVTSASPTPLRGSEPSIFPSLAFGALKDLPHRLQLAPELEKEVSAFLLAPAPSAGDRAAVQAYAKTAESLVEKCLAFLESELGRTVEAKLSLGDTNSLQRRNIADPKQQANVFLGELKNRLAAEKAKWPQRTKDQAQDVLDKIEEQMRSFEVHYEVHPGDVKISVDELWKTKLFKWLDGVLTQWATHHNQILEGKTALAAEQPVRDLEKHLGTRLDAKVSPPLPASGRALENELPPLQIEEELVTKAEAFFESLKGGLNTVAMLAGMVIVPVVGFFSDKQPIHIRAAIMGACVMPIFGFAAWATGRQRAKAVEKCEEKGHAAIKKDFEAYLKNRIERFRVELERHAGEYVTSAQAALVSRLELSISSTFTDRESNLVRELARVQLEGDKLADRINIIKQSKGALSTGLMVEIRKKLREVEG